MQWRDGDREGSKPGAGGLLNPAPLLSRHRGHAQMDVPTPGNEDKKIGYRGEVTGGHNSALHLDEKWPTVRAIHL